MNAPLRKVAIAIFVLFGLLFVNLNYVQFVKGDEYRRNPGNARVRISDYERARGAIVVDGQAIATSKETSGKLKFQREYPAGKLYGQITGYQSLIFGNTGIEAAENPVLSGDDDRLFVGRVSALVTGEKPRGGNVVLTLDKEVQQTTTEVLGDQPGAAVALDPRTGAILGLVSNPSYDPNPFASHSDAPQQEAFKELNADPSKPLLNRALNETYPPGSTFKVVMSSALLKEGFTPDTVVDAPDRYTPPQTTKFIQNFAGESCFGGKATLQQALTISCNTPFAKLGVEKVGADRIRAQAKLFGFTDDQLKVPLKASPSEVGPMGDPPAVAQSSIGQRDVRMTPLQGAMIAAAVANNGSLMRPYLVKEVQAPNYSTLDTTRPSEYSQALSSSQAQDLQQMMESVVRNGTGKKARISGVVVGGKTGTAEDGDERQDHDWFIGFAMVGGEPVAAVAVVLENAGKSSSTAAQIAGTVMRSVISQRGQR